jgi:hypothetical protein
LQPAYAASGGVNNRPYLSGTGTQALAATIPVIAQPFEYVAVVQPTSTSGDQLFVDMGVNVLHMDINGGNYQIGYSSAVTGPAAAVNTLATVDGVFDNTTSTLSVDGATPISGTIGNTASTSTTMTVMNYGAGGFGLKGNMYELIVVSTVISGPNQTLLQAYLDTLYGEP